MSRLKSFLFALPALSLLLPFLAPRSADATPVYAKKEKKECGFCHVNPRGAGKRTDAGNYYKAHAHSLIGFGASAKPTSKKAATPKPGSKKTR